MPNENLKAINREEYQIKQVRIINKLLWKWNGGVAQIWSLTTSLPTLSLRLLKDESRLNDWLQIDCQGLISIQGSFRWTKSELSFEIDNEGVLHFRDAQAEFALKCQKAEAREVHVRV